MRTPLKAAILCCVVTCAASAQSKAVGAFALKIADDHAKEVTDMKNGKGIMKAHIIFSSDGKLRTSHTAGFDITIRPVERVVVWERVGS